MATCNVTLFETLQVMAFFFYLHTNSSYAVPDPWFF
jgi:hypothetical protein